MQSYSTNRIYISKYTHTLFNKYIIIVFGNFVLIIIFIHKTEQANTEQSFSFE